MPHDEALGLAQILLTLLVFALGIPALIIETSSEERVRHLLHRRVRGGPIALMCITLLVVVVLIFVSGWPASSVVPENTLTPGGGSGDWLVKAATILLIFFFAVVWVQLMSSDIRMRLIDDISQRMQSSFAKKDRILPDDLEDLVSLGETLTGADKTAVIDAIGKLCELVQKRRGYDGTELERLVEGLQRVVQGVRYPSTEENYRRALGHLTECWKRLTKHKFTQDRDAGFLKEAASSLGETAVASGSEKIALRCMIAIPGVVELPYRVGMAGLRAGRVRIANEGLSRLEGIASEKRELSWQLIAVVSYICLEGGSIAAHARGFGRRLGFSNAAVLAAARGAADHLASIAEFAAADIVREVWRPASPGKVLRRFLDGVLG